MKNIKKFLSAAYSNIARLHSVFEKKDNDHFYSVFNTEQYDEEEYSGIPEKTVIIASTPRVGSSLLLRGLISTKVIPAATEFFNDVHRTDFSIRWGELSDTDYIHHLYRCRTNKHGIFAVKSHYSQFLRYMDIILRNNCFFIYIERQNKILQAISFFIASLSGSWSSERSPDYAPTEKDYDFYSCYNFLRDIISQNESWCDFFRNIGVSPIYVVYEEFTASYEQTIANIIGSLSGTDIRGEDISAPLLKKQRNELTGIFYERFINDMVEKNINYVQWQKNLMFTLI